MDKLIRFTSALLTGALLAGLSAGCTQKPVRPATSPELKGTLRTAFKDGSAQAKEMADAAESALENQDRARAFALLNGLSAAVDLTPEQRQASTHAASVMREELAKDAAKGDQEAASLLQAYRSNK